MDRLAIDSPIPYDPDEAAMHVARYSIALPFAKGRTVLDSSCGEGHGSWLLAQNGATHVTGVDTSAEAIRTATAIFQAPSLSFFECEKTRLTDLFPSSSFDLVVSLETIQHFSNPEDYLRALQTVATADAIMIISCPNDHWYYPERSSNPYHYRKYSLAEFQELTSKILGPQVSWHIGTALFGFVTEPIAQQTAEHSSAWAYGITVPDSLTKVPSGPKHRPTDLTCSYFVGVWNSQQSITTTGAWYSAAMDRRAHVSDSSNRSNVLLSSNRLLAKQLTHVRLQSAIIHKEHSYMLSRFHSNYPYTHYVSVFRNLSIKMLKRSPVLFQLVRAVHNWLMRNNA
jgi:ubiquinone/menaquinone biosynthesis C-methylase UbiE